MANFACGFKNGLSRSALGQSMMKERPIFITILALLHIAGSFVLLCMQPQLLASLDEISEATDVLGVPPILLIVGVLFLLVIGFASGFGMWFGKRWGWWCGAFYYVYGVAKNANSLIIFHELADLADDTTRGVGYYYFKYGGRLVIHSLILLYLFSHNVRKYFDVDGVHRGKAIAILVAITAGIFGLTMAIGWMYAASTPGSL